MSPFPPHPAFGTLRLATPSDILRIGIVATASLRYSPAFRWRRPRHRDFPRDTLLSYRRRFRDAVMSDHVVVLVAEDAFDPDEDRHTDAVIPPGNGWIAPAAGDATVVGVMSISLEPGSARRGQFVPKDGDYPQFAPCADRDMHRQHSEAWSDRLAALRRRHCVGFSHLTTLAVHPAYWRRGHGTRLATWSANLCRLDGVAQDVFATPMGARLYRDVGFGLVCRVEAPGDEDVPEGASAELLELVPSRALTG